MIIEFHSHSKVIISISADFLRRITNHSDTRTHFSESNAYVCNAAAAACLAYFHIRTSAQAKNGNEKYVCVCKCLRSSRSRVRFARNLPTHICTSHPYRFCCYQHTVRLQLRYATHDESEKDTGRARYAHLLQTCLRGK